MSDPIDNEEAEFVAEESFDASDPKQVNEARKNEGRKRANSLRVVEGIMSLKEGRKWMYDLLVRCHVGCTPYLSERPYDSAFQMGEQNIGLILQADIGLAAPDKYQLMLKEANEK